MGRPVVRGRKLITKGSEIIGVCLGHGGYFEHNCSSSEANAGYVKKIQFLY